MLLHIISLLQRMTEPGLLKAANNLGEAVRDLQNAAAKLAAYAHRYYFIPWASID